MRITGSSLQTALSCVQTALHIIIHWNLLLKHSVLTSKTFSLMPRNNVLENEWSGSLTMACRFDDGSIELLEDFVRKADDAGPACNGAGTHYWETAVDVRHVQEFSYDAFVAEYMLRNRPVLIKASQPWSESWPFQCVTVDVQYCQIVKPYLSRSWMCRCHEIMQTSSMSWAAQGSQAKPCVV